MSNIQNLLIKLATTITATRTTRTTRTTNKYISPYENIHVNENHKKMNLPVENCL